MTIKALYNAIRQVDAEKVSMLLENAAVFKKLNQTPNEENETVLTLAAMMNDDPDTSDLGRKAPLAVSGIIKELMTKGADPCQRNFSGKAALHLCAYESKLSAGRALLESGADPDVPDDTGKPPIYWAVKQNHLDAVKLLLEFKAKVDIPINSLAGDTVVHDAIMTADRDVVLTIIDHVQDINVLNSRGENLLYFTALTDRDVIAQKLIDKGIDVCHQSNKKATAIHACCRLNHVKVLRLLLNLNMITQAFMDMAISKDSEVIDGTETTIVGWTALHLAAAQGHSDTVDLLIEKGANKDLKTANGKTALQLAEMYKKNGAITGLGGTVPEPPEVKDKPAKTKKGATDIGPGWKNFNRK